MQLCQACSWRMSRERSWLWDGWVHRKHHARINDIKSKTGSDWRPKNRQSLLRAVTDYHQPWEKFHSSCQWQECQTRSPEAQSPGLMGPDPHACEYIPFPPYHSSLYIFLLYILYSSPFKKKIQGLLKTLKTPAFMVSLIFKFSF